MLILTQKNQYSYEHNTESWTSYACELLLKKHDQKKNCTYFVLHYLALIPLEEQQWTWPVCITSVNCQQECVSQNKYIESLLVRL